MPDGKRSYCAIKFIIKKSLRENYNFPHLIEISRRN